MNVVQDMSVYVRKVQFKLHESYPNPIRSELKFKCDAVLVNIEFSTNSFNEAAIRDKRDWLG